MSSSASTRAKNGNTLQQSTAIQGWWRESSNCQTVRTTPLCSHSCSRSQGLAAWLDQCCAAVCSSRQDSDLFDGRTILKGYVGYQTTVLRAWLARTKHDCVEPCSAAGCGWTTQPLVEYSRWRCLPKCDVGLDSAAFMGNNPRVRATPSTVIVRAALSSLSSLSPPK